MTAAFIVLAPRTNIHVLLIFFIIGLYKIPSMLFVLFFVLFDVFSLLTNLSGNNDSTTAWIVHFGGYLSGFFITFLLLKVKIIASTQFDLTEIFRQSSRRRQYQKAIALNPSQKKPTSNRNLPRQLTSASIAQTVLSGNTLAAADQFLTALQTDPAFTLDEKTQLQIGNALMHAGRIEEGVRVHELFIKTHPSATSCCEVALLLAAKYARTLQNATRAKELLHEYASEFTEKHQALVSSLAEEIDS